MGLWSYIRNDPVLSRTGHNGILSMQKTHGTLDNGRVGSSHGTVLFDVKFLLDGTVIEELGAKTA